MIHDLCVFDQCLSAIRLFFAHVWVYLRVLQASVFLTRAISLSNIHLLAGVGDRNHYN